MVACIKFSAGMPPQVTDGNNQPPCPAECVDDKGMLGAATGDIRPVALSFDPTTRRLAIGADNSSSITVVDLDANFLPSPDTMLQVPLETKPPRTLGVTALALSSVIGMGGN